MKLLEQNGFPYIFNPESCRDCEGRCCTGKSGNIWVNTSEIKSIADALGKNQIDCMQEYLQSVGNRWSIKEVYSGNHTCCIFFEEQLKSCRIYTSRPGQCKSFPFWGYYRDRVAELMRECPGVREKK